MLDHFFGESECGMGRVFSAVIRTTVVAMASTAMLAAAETAASAGGGVQVGVCSGSGKSGKAVITGWNQHGEFKSSPTIRYSNGGCGVLWNWWWTGSRVHINFANDGENYGGMNCSISHARDGETVACTV